MSVKELDVVKLKDGREVTILECYDNFTAFLVESSDKSGKAEDTFIIKLSNIIEIIYSA